MTIVGELLSRYTNQSQMSNYFTDKVGIVSVKSFDAVGDGVTDDTDDIQDAIDYCTDYYDTNGIKLTLFFPSGLYKISSAITASDSEVNIEMDGFLYFDASVSYGFDFTNISNLKATIKIKGDSMQETDFVYSTDYSVNVSGLATGIRMTNCESSVLNVFFDEFYGRGIETIGSWQFNWGEIRGVVGQTIFIKHPVGSTKSGIGSVGNIHVEELAGSYFNGIDITVKYYENYIGPNASSASIIFDTCGSLWISSMSVGYSTVGNSYMVQFLDCSNFEVSHLYAYGGYDATGAYPTPYSKGVYMYRCYSGKMNLNTVQCIDALLVEGLKGVFINWNDTTSLNNGTIRTITGYNVNTSEIRLNSRYRQGAGLVVENTATDGGTNDGLKLFVYGLDLYAGNADDIDLTISDTTGNITIGGRMTKADLQATNTVRELDAVVGNYTNEPNYSVTEISYNGWRSHTPVLTWTTADPTGVVTNFDYKQIGKTVFYRVRIYADDGNGATGLKVSLPIVPKTTNLLGVLPFYKVVETAGASLIQMRIMDNGVDDDLQHYYFGTATAGKYLIVYMEGFYEKD